MNGMDLTNQRYGRLLVTDFVGYGEKSKKKRWKCLCDCGNICVVDQCHLRSGHTTSCGCFHKERLVDVGKNNRKFSVTVDRLRRIYCSMITRCYNQNNRAFRWYGAKGITVCQEWRDDKQNFIKWALENGYSETLTLDRIDSNGNYDPSNCRWVDVKTQIRNRSNTIKLYGKPLAEWCDILHLDYKVILRRMYSGSSFEEAISKPFRSKDGSVTFNACFDFDPQRYQ